VGASVITVGVLVIGVAEPAKWQNTEHSGSFSTMDKLRYQPEPARCIDVFPVPSPRIRSFEKKKTWLEEVVMNTLGKYY